MLFLLHAARQHWQQLQFAAANINCRPCAAAAGNKICCLFSLLLLANTGAHYTSFSLRSCQCALVRGLLLLSLLILLVLLLLIQLIILQYYYYYYGYYFFDTFLLLHYSCCYSFIVNTLCLLFLLPLLCCCSLCRYCYYFSAFSSRCLCCYVFLFLYFSTTFLPYLPTFCLVFLLALLCSFFSLSLSSSLLHCSSCTFMFLRFFPYFGFQFSKLQLF